MEDDGGTEMEDDESLHEQARARADTLYSDLRLQTFMSEGQEAFRTWRKDSQTEPIAKTMWELALGTKRPKNFEVQRLNRRTGQRDVHRGDLDRPRSVPAEEGESDSSDSWSEASSGSITSTFSPEGKKGGLKSWYPAVYSWVRARMTTRDRSILLILFIIFDSGRFMMFEYAIESVVNPVSIFATAYMISFVFSISICFGLEGRRAWTQIFDWHALWRWSGISVFFVLATFLNALAYRSGIAVPLINMLGKMYLPVVALASYCVFKRTYGKLEWLALLMLMLGIISWILLRERCHVEHCPAVDLVWGIRPAVMTGALFVLISVAMSATASVLAERIYKDESAGLIARGDRRGSKYYIRFAQLYMTTSLLWGLMWISSPLLLPMPQLFGRPVDAKEVGWFGHWTKRQYVIVFFLVGQAWLAGQVTAEFSSVVKAVINSVSTVIVIMFSDAISGADSYWERFIPSMLITVIVVLSALIFQTGRINLRQIQKHMSPPRRKSKESDEEAQGPTPSDVDRLSIAISDLKHKVEDNPIVQAVIHPTDMGLCGTCLKYSPVILYILADAVRSVLSSVVQSNRFFVPQTMQVMCSFCGASFALAMTARAEGKTGVLRALEREKLVKFIVVGFLQAVSGSFVSLAYALGTSPSLVVAFGKVYTPLVAIFSSCVLGKYFMWLEWFALIILTFASFTFGALASLGGGQHKAPLAGMACVLMSATASCLMSLVMEKLMKSEKDPFIIQKVRLDISSFVFSVLFVPIIGTIAVLPFNYRQDLAFWTYRPGPDYWACEAIALDIPDNALRGCNQTSGEFMVNWTSVNSSNPEMRLLADACVCGRGLFLGWGAHWLNYLALFVVVFHSWVTGLLVTQFSSVFRAVADGIPVLLLYFFLDPLSTRVPIPAFESAFQGSGPLPFPPSDLARNAVCLILPLSGMAFSCASAEMQKAFDAVQTCARRTHHNTRTNTGISSLKNPNEDESEEERTQDGALE